MVAAFPDPATLMPSSAGAPEESAQHWREALLEYQATLENAWVGIAFTRDRKVLHCNPRFSEIFGWPHGDLTGQPGLVLYPSAEAYSEMGRVAGPVLAAGEVYEGELTMRRMDGSTFLAYVHAKAIDAANTRAGTIWIAEDITERRAAEARLQNLLIEQQAILENASSAIIFTRDGIVVHCNPQLEAMYGWPPGSLIGQPGSIFFQDADDYRRFGEVAGPILSAGDQLDVEWRTRRRDGTSFWCRILAKAIDRGDGGRNTIWINEDISARKESEAAIRKLLAEQQAILENASVSIVFTQNGNIMHCNPRAEEMYGWPPGTLIGQPAAAFFVDADDYARFGAQAGPILAAGKQLDIEWRNARQDGSTFWCRNLAKAIERGDGEQNTIWITEDITARKEAEARMHKLLLEQRAILDNASVGILFTRNGMIVDCNPRMEEIFGWSRGTLAGNGTPVFFADAEEYTRFGEAVRPALAAGELLDIEWHNLRKDGSRVWCRHLARGVDLGDGQLSTVWITEDISQRKATEEALRRAHDEMEQRVRDRTIELATANARLHAEVEERQQAEERVRHMANHDALTGLPNRRLLHDRLRQAIALAHRHRNKVAVMFIDLDRFKNINDSLGHASGDALLQQVGKRISAELREGDTVARLGGDEFVIVLPELGDANDAAIVAHKLTGAFVAPFAIAGVEAHISPSIGIAIYPDDGTDPETLTRNADTAMYHAKDMGRNNHQFFTDQMNVAAAQRFALENKLHRALDRDELRLHYQPRIAIDTRHACGFEALLRWHDPEQGMIAPSSFIPVAEDSSLIVPIGKWVLREVCRQHMAWRAAGYAPLPIAVNLSPREFRQPDLVDTVARALADSGMEARYLALEITEGTLMQATAHTLETLEALNALGVGLSIDDFGVGYSSLSYLKRFPVDQLKIDQSFVRDIATDPDDAAIVSAIIGLARNLQLSVVAEGVETEAQLAFIAASGCNEAQGFFFSQPLPAEEAAQRFLAPLH